MTIIQDLPDLVIIGILRNAVNEVIETEDLVFNLPYLAICQRWRHLALPIVYRNVVIKYDFELDEDGEAVYKLVSNTSLLTNVKCNLMVKRIYICWTEFPLIDNLHILMNAVSMGKMAWPKDVSIHLIGDTSDGRHHFNPQKLDTEMYEKMSAIIENFRDTFPNIKEMKTSIRYCCGVVSQFISKFVEVYYDQLTKLINYDDIPLDLPYFPPNLEYLSYHFQGGFFLPVPKINTLSLKVLRLCDIPKDFSWKQSCNSLVFPNLKSLYVRFLDSDDQGKREELAHKLGVQLNIPNSQQEQLEFPAIEKLDFKQNHA